VVVVVEVVVVVVVGGGRVVVVVVGPGPVVVVVVGPGPVVVVVVVGGVVVVVVVVVGGLVTVKLAVAASANSPPVQKLQTPTTLVPGATEGTTNETLTVPFAVTVQVATDVPPHCETGLAGSIPKRTSHGGKPGVKPDPVTVTVVPGGPDVGDSEIAGAAWAELVGTTANEAATTNAPTNDRIRR
jgi:hypothetical protein